MATATITKRQEWQKIGRIDYTVDGKHGSAAFWKGDAFADKLQEGQTVELTFEKKPKRDKPDETEAWVASVNGEGAKAKTGGGGGRPAYQPKPREETHGPCIAGLIKECIAQGDVDLVLAERAIKLYKEALKEFAPC